MYIFLSIFWVFLDAVFLPKNCQKNDKKLKDTFKMIQDFLNIKSKTFLKKWSKSQLLEFIWELNKIEC